MMMIDSGDVIAGEESTEPREVNFAYGVHGTIRLIIVL